MVGFGLFSCQENSGTNKNKKLKSIQKLEKTNSVNQKETKTFKEFSLISGVWRIDSVAENIEENIVANFTGEKFEAFNFRRDGVFSMIQKDINTTSDIQQGNYRVTKDSIVIFSNKNIPLMSYGYERTTRTLILKGNFLVSSSKRAKPIFFLSKIEDKDI